MHALKWTIKSKQRFINTKNPSKTIHVLFWDVSDYSYFIFSQKIKQHLAMSAIQNQKDLRWYSEAETSVDLVKVMFQKRNNGH